MDIQALKSRRRVFKVSDILDSGILQYAYFIAAIFINIFSKVAVVDGKTVFVNNFIPYGITAFVIVISLQLIFCRHISNTLLPFLLISCFTLKCYNSFDEFMKLAYMAIPFAVALVLRLFLINRREFHADAVFKSLIPVAIAVTAGGVGTITFAEYVRSLYYVFGLGIGMMMLYYVYYTQYQTDDTYDLEADYTNTMCLVALYAIFMIVHHYIMSLSITGEIGTLLTFQWRNNISTILIITMPFLFHAARRNFVCFPMGIISFAAILLTSSRGGAVFGALELFACIIVYSVVDKKASHRISVGVTIASLIIIFAVIFSDKAFIEKVFPRLAGTFQSIESMKNEVRYKLIARAEADFLRNPVFGSGLGYSGNADLYNPVKGAAYFYHSAPLQIVGSLGIVGIVAYLTQFYFQGKALFSARTKFAATIAVSVTALWGMSMVNPGVFAPVPYAMLIPLHLLVASRTAKSKTVPETR